MNDSAVQSVPTKKQPARKAPVRKSPPMVVAPAPPSWPPIWMKTLFVMTLILAWIVTFIGRYTVTGFQPPPFIDGAFFSGFMVMLGLEGVKRARNGNH